jgi:hypothetical protein
VVWFPMATPRHAFLLWLVFKNALVTKDIMCYWGFDRNSLCRFCYGNRECIEYLFFHCNFSKRIWCNLTVSCLVPDPYVD